MATTLEQGGATHQHISHLGKHIARIKAQKPPRGGEKRTHVLKGNGDKGNHSGNVNLCNNPKLCNLFPLIQVPNIGPR
jgi:hypothetical protein